MSNDYIYMEKAYQEAKKALAIDEVPIGAIVVYHDMIIGYGYNKRETEQQVVAHAEMIALQQACSRLQSWRLDECDIYITLEPCIMCSGAIIQSRCKRVIYGAPSKRWASLSQIIDIANVNHHPEIIGGIMEESCASLLSQYFVNKR